MSGRPTVRTRSLEQVFGPALGSGGWPRAASRGRAGRSAQPEHVYGSSRRNARALFYKSVTGGGWTNIETGPRRARSGARVGSAAPPQSTARQGGRGEGLGSWTSPGTSQLTGLGGSRTGPGAASRIRGGRGLFLVEAGIARAPPRGSHSAGTRASRELGLLARLRLIQPGASSRRFVSPHEILRQQ